MNHAPEGTIEVEESSQRLFKNGGALFRAHFSDLDDHELHYEWRGEVVPSAGEEDQGQRLFLISPDGQVDANSSQVLSTQSVLDLTFKRRGTYTVSLRGTDIYGAEQHLTVTRVAKNVDPVIDGVILERDPAVLTDQVPDVDGGYPVHAHYMARIDYTDAKSVDPDRDLMCGRTGKVTWELLQPAADQVVYAEVIPCRGEEMTDSRMRFQLRKSAVPASVTINVLVEDGLGGSDEQQKTFPLSANRPPCITETMPDSQAPAIKALHSAEKRFEAGFFNDDVQERYSFTWSVQDQEGGNYRELPGQSGSSLVLPPWFRPPGTSIRLRLMILEPDGEVPGCSVEEGHCKFAPTLPGECYQWVTWRVEFI